MTASMRKINPTLLSKSICINACRTSNSVRHVPLHINLFIVLFQRDTRNTVRLQQSLEAQKTHERIVAGIMVRARDVDAQRERHIRKRQHLALLPRLARFEVDCGFSFTSTEQLLLKFRSVKNKHVMGQNCVVRQFVLFNGRIEYSPTFSSSRRSRSPLIPCATSTNVLVVVPESALARLSIKACTTRDSIVSGMSCDFPN